MRVFFLVLARDSARLGAKIKELSQLGHPFLVVCGEKVNHPNVVYRAPKGKYDAINFGLHFIPSDTDVVAFNDVDAEIHNVKAALNVLHDKNVSMVFAKVNVKKGPQRLFYSFRFSNNRNCLIASSIPWIVFDVTNS